ncbi:hypothetical protein, conserved [Trypanosoma brucei gambiense DAL972]|uniref:Proteasome assembly chaperone 3 n=2 Tax=Trypanosoma brucei TaxID=5691 RepID=C9ZIZ7_TRYB9|nr:hypothetical protein, conserved [Trypanosoma brucei gambiense DAL972]RHW74135.1 hypothetical protein DPX39_020005900 [Trypanosoma brucei equiperdum]CBH09355.1 hypothetical protein, conserved [Trypanosoma brucei gambiense DAL972]|eukprot:XP_011771661.1 hypothetical protein, conserved [Trypanosoma brucei gambiense DAL972]
MPAPSLATRHFTFTHEVPADDVFELEENAPRRVPIACVTLQMVSFNRRCFWFHIAMTREGFGAPPPPFGACAVSFSGVSGDSAATTLVDDTALPQLGFKEAQHEVGVGAPNPQAVFADSLARRLSRRLEREFTSGVAVYVACGIIGEHQSDLLGTPAGYGSEVTRRFGAEVFKHAMDLICEEGLGKATAA